jgi:xanthine dehydrogenase/oxidase
MQLVRLTGSKEGCSEGGCGACTVLQSRFDSESGKILNLAINACLTPLCSVHGSAIITVEGIGSVSQGLHPIQVKISKYIILIHCLVIFYDVINIKSHYFYCFLRKELQKVMEHNVVFALQALLCQCMHYLEII